MGKPGLRTWIACATLALALLAVVSGPSNAEPGGYRWDLPQGFPQPYVPADNPMTEAKVALGRYLFYDTRLSVNGKKSCASCHKQELAFTDGRPVAIGATGEAHPRNAMSLVNVAWAGVLTWSNPGLKRLEKQMLTPMFGEHPVELGMKDIHPFLRTAQADATYRSLFERAFPDAGSRYILSSVTKALASFERSIVSARSPYDRYHFGGDDSAVSESAKRGEVLFFSQPFRCFRCHGGFNFSGSTVSARNPDRTIEFHNTGLYNLAGALSYPAPNVGIFEYTKLPADVGKFKAPTLRNIAVTAPYMHDGSIATLEGVLDHYAAGGRTIASGRYAGVGHNNPNKDPLIGGFALSVQNKADLIAFLKSLTDDAVLHDPRFANPWPGKQ